jgi:transmembrane sensor
MQNTRFTILLEHYLNGSLTKAEAIELTELLENPTVFQEFNQLMESQLNGHFYDEQVGLSLTSERISTSIISKLKLVHNNAGKTRISHLVHFLSTAWFRYAAAIILVLGVVIYVFSSRSNLETPVITEELNKPPGKDRAILILSDGREIVLDNSNTENISDGSISIKKSDGVLTYNPMLISDAKSITYNTMNTPRGGQYQLVLPDGSKVWLNAASSIRYPTIFHGKNRMIELIGEAYFDIKANKKMPFIVKTQNAEVLVLGTAFNVNSYTDEPQFSTTLINGSVKVSAAGIDSKIIISSQQVQLSNSKPCILEVKDNVDIDKVVAWQKGIFAFKGVSLDVIARQLSRWYDVEIVVGNNKTKKLSGGISKKTPLRTVLDNLEVNGVFHKWENNIITLYTKSHELKEKS